jgi:hypothetical protein
VSAFGVQGVGEIAYFVGCYCLISSLLKTFDVNLPAPSWAEQAREHLRL